MGRSCGGNSGGCDRTSNRCGRNERSKWASYTRICGGGRRGGGGRDTRVGGSGIGFLLGSHMDIKNGLHVCSWELNIDCWFLLE